MNNFISPEQIKLLRAGKNSWREVAPVILANGGFRRMKRIYRRKLIIIRLNPTQQLIYRCSPLGLALLKEQSNET